MKTQEPTQEQKVKGCAALLLVFIGLITVFYVGCGDEDPTPQREDAPQLATDINVRIWSHECVKEQLVSPSTAKFDLRDEGIVHIDDSTFVVRGTVDSQNRFGAMIRSSYSMTLRHFPSIERYRCDNLTIE